MYICMPAQCLSKILTSFFFLRNPLAFSMSARVPLAVGMAGGKSSFQTCQPAPHKVCIWVAEALAAPVAPAALLPWHWRHSLAFFIFRNKNARGKHLLLQKFGMTVSFSTGLFFYPSPHKEVNKCLLFFLVSIWFVHTLLLVCV